MSPIEIFTSLDLEMNQPSRKIIQVGACAGNITTGKILGKLSIFVNPNEQLNQEIIDLTGITQRDVDSGTTLLKAYEVLSRFHNEHDSFINPITWGGGDSQEILQQLRSENPETAFAWCFGRRWIDAKTLFVSMRFANGLPIQGGLAKSMLKVGLRFQGRKHNATDDSVNTFYMYHRMLQIIKENPQFDNSKLEIK